MENNERYELCKVTVIGIIRRLGSKFMGVAKVQAQEFKVQGDLVSSYVWRGFIKPGLVSSDFRLWVGGFSLTAWALPISTEQAPRTVRLPKK